MMISGLTPDTTTHYAVKRMAKKGQKTNTSMRTTPDDKKLLNELQAKTGLNQTSVLRLALRRLAESEGLRVA